MDVKINLSERVEDCRQEILKPRMWLTLFKYILLYENRGFKNANSGVSGAWELNNKSILKNLKFHVWIFVL